MVPVNTHAHIHKRGDFPQRVYWYIPVKRKNNLHETFIE